MSLEAEIKTRVPDIIKQGFDALRKKKFKSESELAREAFVLYFQSQGIDLNPKNKAKKKI